MRHGTKGSIRRRLLVLFASLTTLGGVQAVALAPVIHASVPASCTWGDIYYEMGTQSKPVAITHEKYISLAPNSTYSHSTTLSLALTFSVKVTGTVSGTVEANAILGKAAATASLSVELMGSATGTASFTDTFTVANKTSTQKHFVLYEGVRELTGTWTKWQCTRFEVYQKTGNSGTYQTYYDEPEGDVMCEATSGLDALDLKAKAFC